VWTIPRVTTRRMIVVVAVVAVALAMVIEGEQIFLEPAPSALRTTNFRQIKPGLTRKQVSELLGGPPGDYGKNADGIIESGDGSVFQVFYVPNSRQAKMENWQDDVSNFFIFFDDEGHVIAASRSNYVRRYPNSRFLHQIRQIIRRLRM
jgi:hypothetical protein